MKSTFEISDALVVRTRRFAKARGLTMKATIELGLRKLLDAESEQPEPFRLQRASVGGSGLSDWAKAQTCGELIASSYEGRGE
jgi:hypothetical protein